MNTPGFVHCIPTCPGVLQPRALVLGSPFLWWKSFWQVLLEDSPLFSLRKQQALLPFLGLQPPQSLKSLIEISRNCGPEGVPMRATGGRCRSVPSGCSSCSVSCTQVTAVSPPRTTSDSQQGQLSSEFFLRYSLNFLVEHFLRVLAFHGTRRRKAG